MKKFFIPLLFAAFGVSMSCIKEKEENSTEIQNLKQDIADLKVQVAELRKEPKDTILHHAAQQAKAKDGFEGQKSQY